MSTLQRMAQAAFRKAWTRYGKPTMTVVKPIASWSLPDGFAYDTSVDAIRNNGIILPNPEDYWITEQVYIVPDDPGSDMRVLIAAGIVPSGTLTLSILSNDAETVRAAHAVQVDGAWYDVAEVVCEPAGGPGAWCNVQLRRRS